MSSWRGEYNFFFSFFFFFWEGSYKCVKPVIISLCSTRSESSCVLGCNYYVLYFQFFLLNLTSLPEVGTSGCEDVTFQDHLWAIRKWLYSLFTVFKQFLSGGISSTVCACCWSLCWGILLSSGDSGDFIVYFYWLGVIQDVFLSVADR